MVYSFYPHVCTSAKCARVLINNVHVCRDIYHFLEVMIYLLNDKKNSIIESYKRHGKITKLCSSIFRFFANFDHTFFFLLDEKKINFEKVYNIVGDIVYWVYLS